MRFRWLLAGRAVDQLGNAVQPLALGFAMLAVFDSTTALGLVVGSASLGQVLLLLAGGVVADRLPRSMVLVWSNVAAAAAQAGIVTLVAADVRALPSYAVMAFLGGAAAAFDGPATMALVPEIVPPQALPRANSQMVIARQSAAIGGAPLAGILVATAGVTWALALNAVSFAAAALCFARVGGGGTVRSATSSSLDDLVEGWREFVRHTWVWVVVLVAFVLNALYSGGFAVVGLAIGKRAYGAEGWGLVLGAFTAGALLGAVVAGRVRARRPLVVGLLAASSFAGPMFALAAGAPLLILVTLTFVTGAGLSQFGIAWESALQRHIPPDRLARVSSIDILGSTAAVPLGAFLAGPLADRLGGTVVVNAAGIGVAVVCLAALLSRDVRGLRSDVPGRPSQAES